MRLRPALAAALLACVFGASSAQPAPARVLHARPLAEPAPPDTALDRFLGAMSDSTSGYFGVVAAQPDTAGLDSALAHGLAHDAVPEPRRTWSVGPGLGFSRVDGPVYLVNGGIGDAFRRGRIEGRAGWASGPNDMLGGGTYRKSLPRGDATWTLRLHAGRRTDRMDPDYGSDRLSMLQAFLSGSDHKNYLRRDGFETFVGRTNERWRVEAGYRNLLERPIATSATWNLTGAHPDVIDNLPAARGRNQEFQFEAGARLFKTPAWFEVRYASSAHAIGSDFEYRRTRVALAADLAVGRWLAVVPQLGYGRLTGDAIPQASFYIGGPNTIRSIRSATRGGTGLAIVRLDLIEAHDLLQVARIPHPAWLPLQAAAFAAAGATWGKDPYGGPARGGLDWPDPEHWVSEAGAALLWRPGIPDPTGFMRFSYALPLGPERESSRFKISYSRALGLLRRIDD